MKLKKKSQKNKSSSGFTLIELLVVISVITFLASILLVAVKDIRITARNTKRNADTLQLFKAFNFAYDNSGGLPDTSAIPGSWVCISATCYGGLAGYSNDATTTAFLAPFLPNLPADPPDSYRGAGGFLYRSDWPGGASLYNGSLLPAGAVIWYYLEPTKNTPNCGSGLIWKVQANFTVCGVFIR